VELELIRERATEAADRARKNPDKDRLKEKAIALRDEYVTRQIDVLKPRVERHPNDTRMRFDLAELYRKTKQYTSAIPLYQQASADSRLKEDSLVWLGECFIRTGKLDLGRRQFEKALETLSKEKPDAFKTAHYCLGRVYEKAKKNDLAESHYSEILLMDYEYKDVQKRLEDLQAASGGLDLLDDEEVDI
jgi:tetratricopeptide (TPR) repeat protein